MLLLEEVQSDWCQELRAADLGEPNFDPPPPNPYQRHWVELGLRVMLLLAAERDFDGLGWLPGDLHAERFPGADAYGLTMFYNQVVPTAVRKLAKSWGASVGTTAIDTSTREHAVEKCERGDRWQIRHRPSGRLAPETFDAPEKAALLRDALEKPSEEIVPCLFISPEMRVDLMKNGLPRLGATSKRDFRFNLPRETETTE